MLGVFLSLFLFSIVGLFWTLNEKAETQTKLDRLKDNIMHLKTARALKELRYSQFILEIFVIENALKSIENGTLTEERYLIFSREIRESSERFYAAHQELMDEIDKNTTKNAEEKCGIIKAIKGLFDPKNDKICPNVVTPDKNEGDSPIFYDAEGKSEYSRNESVNTEEKPQEAEVSETQESQTVEQPLEEVLKEVVAVTQEEKTQEPEASEIPISEALAPEIVELKETLETVEFSEIKKVDSKIDELEGVLFPKIRSYKWIMGNRGLRGSDGISRKQKLYDYIVKTIELNDGRVKGEVVVAYLLLKAFGVKKIEDVKNEADLGYIKYEFDNLKSSAYFGAKKYRKDDFNIIHEPSGLGVEKEDGEPSCVIRKVRHCTYLNKAELFARDARKEKGE